VQSHSRRPRRNRTCDSRSRKLIARLIAPFAGLLGEYLRSREIRGVCSTTALPVSRVGAGESVHDENPLCLAMNFRACASGDAAVRGCGGKVGYQKGDAELVVKP
jgi:hypothetical protein